MKQGGIYFDKINNQDMCLIPIIDNWTFVIIKDSVDHYFGYTSVFTNDRINAFVNGNFWNFNQTYFLRDLSDQHFTNGYIGQLSDENFNLLKYLVNNFN